MKKPLVELAKPAEAYCRARAQLLRTNPVHPSLLTALSCIIHLINLLLLLSLRSDFPWAGPSSTTSDQPIKVLERTLLDRLRLVSRRFAWSMTLARVCVSGINPLPAAIAQGLTIGICHFSPPSVRIC